MTLSTPEIIKKLEGLDQDNQYNQDKLNDFNAKLEIILTEISQQFNSFTNYQDNLNTKKCQVI